MWRFKAPLSGRSGEIRSTDGPSRLNISVTLFPNCVVVPEAGTAVRAKQSGAGLGAAQFMEYILILRSHMVSQFYQLGSGAVSIVSEFCTWHLASSCLQSVYLPFILPVSFRQSSSCAFLSHFSLPHSPVPLPASLCPFPVMPTRCLYTLPWPRLSTGSALCTGPASLPGSDFAVSTHTQFRTSVQTWSWIVPWTQGSQTLRPAGTFHFSELSAFSHSELCGVAMCSLPSCRHWPSTFPCPLSYTQSPHPQPRIQAHQCPG